MTKLTAVSPTEKADCPTWEKFLREATRDDEELIRFLQVVCGYAMTGDTREHLLVFIHGPGGSGKGTFLYTIANVLGDYATEAAMETFMESRTDRHPTELAMLRGARVVTSAETTEGRAWAETKIKQMTGGDPITARFMRRDFFTFQPTFQLLIIGNYQPKLHNVNEAMRRRLAIVPFTHQPKERDPKLRDEKLRPEWPGILRWMIDGCLAWQRDGIPRPEAVRASTDAYFEAQDLFGQWLAERTERAPITEGTQSGKLYESWVAYAEAAGERRPGHKNALAERMEQRGYLKRKSDGQQIWVGVRLKRSGGGSSTVAREPSGGEDELPI